MPIHAARTRDKTSQSRGLVNEDHRHRNARLPRPDAELGVRQGPHRSGRACSAGARRRSNGTRGPSSGPIEDIARAARRRRPDAHRTPLADDVPPALLARPRHRPRHRHRRHRPRPLGHPRQGRAACRARSCGAGRSATTSAPTATSAAARWRTSTRRPPTTRNASPISPGRPSPTASPRSSAMAVPPTHADRRAEADPRGRGVRRRDARGRRRRHRHHGRLPRPAVAGDGTAVRQGARTLRPLLLRRAVLARERRRPGGDQRAPSARRSRPASA